LISPAINAIIIANDEGCYYTPSGIPRTLNKLYTKLWFGDVVDGLL
jgi:hypothetical protein